MSGLLDEACELALRHIRDARDKWDEARSRGRAVDDDERPSVSSPRWHRTVAKLLRQAGAVAWYGDAAGSEAASLRDELLADLLALPECEAVTAERIEVRWSTGAMLRRDGPYHEVLIGRPKAIPAAERLVRGGAALWRLDLSLPAFLLAEEGELARPMHSLLMSLGLGSAGPYIRRPDIAAYSATLGRYGARSAREVQAVAHAMAHPGLARELVRHHYDPRTGQGLLWEPRGVVEAGGDDEESENFDGEGAGGWA